MNSQSRNFFRKTTALVAITTIMTSLTSQMAQALDVSAPNVNHSGNVTINQNNNITNINQTTSKELITWGKFDINQPETVNFNSANASDITINKVTGGDRSMIQGMLNSNHRVAVLNDAGVTFTSSARVNVGSLIATTAKDFEESNGQYKFTNANGTGSVLVNQGAEINVSDGGYAVLVAPEVKNAGTIKAKLGRVDLASANGFTIDVNGNGNINYLAGPDLTKSIIENTSTGVINAEGGIVNLRSDKAANLADSVINLNGVINVVGMDANLNSTVTNGSIINANAYGDINATKELAAGKIQLASTAGNINVAALTSINNKNLNTDRAIDLKAGKKITVNGPITVENKLNTETGITRAEVKLDAGEGVELKDTVKITAENKSGGTAKLDINGGTKDVITRGNIQVYAAGTRIVGKQLDSKGNVIGGDGAGDITSTATVNITGKQVAHFADVDVKAYAFHDVRTFIEYLSKTTDVNDNTAMGFYKKDSQGNPVDGEILFADLGGILPGAWADLSFVDFNDVGYFLIPDASTIRGDLTNRQKVTFAQVNGQWVVKDLNGNIIKGADLGNGQNYALFSDKEFNKNNEHHLLNSANGAGQLNWETAITQFCDFNDYNFSMTELGGPGTVKTHASYIGNATGGQFYTPQAGANIYVDSTADAKNSESTAELIITGKEVILGDPHITSRAYKNADAKVQLTATDSSLWINAPLVAQAYAKSRAVGNANAQISIDVTNGDLNFGYQPNSYIIADALGGVKANANTVVNVKGKTRINTNGTITEIPSRILMGDYIGAIAKTFKGVPADATATTTVNTATAGQIYFQPQGHPEGYVFANANGVIAAGGGSATNGNAKLNVLNGATLTTATTYSSGTGDTHTPYKDAVTCGFAGDPCDANPNTNVVGGWKTSTTFTGGTPQTPTAGNYGNGMTVTPIGMPPYERIQVFVRTPGGPGPSPDPNLLFQDPTPEPNFVKQEPATGGGLFCRDVNTAGVPGLCGPAPVQEVAFAPAPAAIPLAPAPVYASPFKKGPSTAAKKAQVANLEPGSGNKCLSINGKKVCIEEQIDK